MPCCKCPVVPEGNDKGPVGPWKDGDVSVQNKCPGLLWKDADGPRINGEDAECSTDPDLDEKEPSVPWRDIEFSRCL